MNQNIIEKIEIDDRSFILVDDSSRMGMVTGFEISTLDAEADNLSGLEGSLTHWVRSLSTDLLVRFILQSEDGIPSIESSRSKSFNYFVPTNNRLYVFFEKNVSGLLKIKNRSDFLNENALKLNDMISLEFFLRHNCVVKPLLTHEYSGFFAQKNQQISTNFTQFMVGESYYGHSKLVSQGDKDLSVLDFSKMKDALKSPYRYQLTIKNSAPYISEVKARKKSKEAAGFTDKVGQAKQDEADHVLEKVSLHGARIISVESQFQIARSSHETLLADLKSISETFRKFGTYYTENVGNLECFRSFGPGSLQHDPFDEMDYVVPAYIPMSSYGNPFLKRKTSPSYLHLLRRDGSLDGYDAFDSSLDSYSTCIFGPPGSGKSLLTNLITRALHNDPNTVITKIDVGGSHSNETKLLGGTEFVLNLNEPCGFNPFSVLKKHTVTSNVIRVLSTYIETLIKEENETFLSKDIKSSIEKSILYYAETRPLSPSVDDYFEICSDFIPRKNQLSRWTNKGVYANACKENPNHQGKFNRLKYYNFSNISQSIDSDFAQGGLAAIMAQFNFDMEFNRNGKRFVFKADEVPVFIKRCFSFFSLSIANIRKLGDVFIIVAQRSSDVVVDGDEGILNNSASKFFYGIDGDVNKFQSRNSLTNEDIEKIHSLKRVQGEFSDVLYSVRNSSSQGSSKIFRITVTPEEYWSMTTKKEDHIKIENLMKAVPGLSRLEAIKCLSVS